MPRSIAQMFPSRFLRATDLPRGQFIRATIASVEVESVDQDTGEAKPVLRFAGKSKGLVLNQVNAATLSQAYGDDPDAWIGRPLLMFVDNALFKGRPVPAIRMKIPTGPQHAPAQRVAPPQQQVQRPPVAPAVARPAPMLAPVDHTFVPDAAPPFDDVQFEGDEITF